jgi:DNA polymerase-1
MRLLADWSGRLERLPRLHDPEQVSVLLPRRPEFYLGQVNFVSTASESEAMAEFVEQRPMGWVGFDTEFRFDRPPLLIDGKTTVHDPRSIRPLLLSLAMAEQDPAGRIRIYRFVVDLRRTEVLPGLERVLGLPCCFVAHHAPAELFCLWKLGLPIPRTLWDSYISERALHLGRGHKRYKARDGAGELGELRAEEEARTEEESGLSLVATCQRYGFEHRFAAVKERLQQSFLVHADDAPFSWEQIEYADEDAAAATRLYPQQLFRAAQEGVLDHLKSIEMPWVTTNARTIWWGVRVDQEKCGRVLRACDEHLETLRPELALHGVTNVKSHKQMVAYFDRHGLLELFRRGGGFSFSKDMLSKYSDRHPAIGLIRAARRVLDLREERILTGELVGVDGRVHPEHRHLGAHTGRQTCRFPNVLGLGKVFRPLIVAEPGRGIGEVDLSQIEVGIAGGVYGDAALVEMFNTGDVYSAMAQRFYGERLDPSDVGLDSKQFKKKHPRLRDQMKICTLGIIYGLTAGGLSKMLGVSRTTASRTLDAFMAMFPDLKRALDRTAALGGIRGYVTTATGLRRYRGSSGPPMGWERKWMTNHPVQGTAAALFKVAGNRLDRLYQRYDAWLILAVDDAFVFEAPLEVLGEVADLTGRVMTEAVAECFPQLRPKVEINVGRPHCWNKDEHDDSIDRWIEDPMFSL